MCMYTQIHSVCVLVLVMLVKTKHSFRFGLLSFHNIAFNAEYYLAFL